MIFDKVVRSKKDASSSGDHESKLKAGAEIQAEK